MEDFRLTLESSHSCYKSKHPSSQKNITLHFVSLKSIYQRKKIEKETERGKKGRQTNMVFYTVQPLFSILLCFMGFFVIFFWSSLNGFFDLQSHARHHHPGVISHFYEPIKRSIRQDCQAGQVLQHASLTCTSVLKQYPL